MLLRNKRLKWNGLNIGKLLDWDQAFAGNRLLASATLDRLRHNAYCLELDGPSYRDSKVAPAAKKGLAKGIEKGPEKGAETTAK